MARPLNDSVYLYGFHDPGGEQIMLDVGITGWVIITEEIGHDPNDRSGRNYRPFTDRGLGVLVRLNNAYNPGGTLPFERFYPDFARRCANFVAASEGAHLWIIGNETNHPIEWPGAQWNWGPGWPAPISPETRGEEITPTRYASCFKQCRAAVKAVAGHGLDQVLTAPPAPWNILLTYPTNPDGDWVKYFADLLKLIGAGNLDGIVVHTYTHGFSPTLIPSEEKLNDPRFSNYHWQFRAYQDFMNAIPTAMRSLPVYITETNQGDEPWLNVNNGWVRAAYAEIDRWNRSGRQIIRSLLLYRWPQVPGDRWGIEGKAGVIEDFKQALGPRYQWTTAEDPMVALTRRVTELEQAAAALKAGIGSASKLAADAAALRKDIEALASQVAAATPGDLRQQLDALAAQVKALEDMIQPGPVGPAVVDKIGKLAQGPTPYPKRDPAAIRRFVVHHTVTPDNITPERLAQAAVRRGLPGITYHYLITGDGTIYATQPLDSAISQTNKANVNADSVGVALAGNFTSAVPTEAQMASAAALLGSLLDRFNLPASGVVGAREVAQTASPGNQWLSGAKYKESLIARVNARAAPKVPGTNALPAQPLATEAPQPVVPSAEPSPSNPGAAAESAATATALVGEIDRLRDLLASQTTGRVVKPPVVDKVDKLAHHPTLPPYSKRTRPISMIVIHHTDTPKTMTAEKIAEYHVFGERKDAQGNVIKAQWPGIGYHFLIGPDGVITQGQRESTRSYHVGGDPNDYSVAISLIGRFMRKNYDGTDRAPEDQVPTPLQLKSAGQLAAWLMQEYNIPLEQIKGHRDVWPKSTVCPGEHWKAGLNWYPNLVQQVQSAQTAAGGTDTKPIPLYLLFWDHGNAWAQGDWNSAQGYIARFRPTSGFSVNDAGQAQRVVIVGGPLGVPAQDEAKLKAAGAEVYRLSGRDEADTQRMLDELAQQGTPWPGAPSEPAAPLALGAAEGAPQDANGLDEVIFPDEWTMPDEWQLPEAALSENQPQQPRPAYPEDLGELLGVPPEVPPPSVPKVFVPAPGQEIPAAGGSHE